LAKVKGVLKGAIKIIARLIPRQRYEQSTGRAPLRCLHRQRDMEVWCIWHPTDGVIYDELEAMRRGKYASQATRADPTRSLGKPFGPSPEEYRYRCQVCSAEMLVNEVIIDVAIGAAKFHGESTGGMPRLGVSRMQWRDFGVGSQAATE
jgi:hypothetical protein